MERGRQGNLLKARGLMEGKGIYGRQEKGSYERQGNRTHGRQGNFWKARQWNLWEARERNLWKARELWKSRQGNLWKEKLNSVTYSPNLHWARHSKTLQVIINQTMRSKETLWKENPQQRSISGRSGGVLLNSGLLKIAKKKSCQNSVLWLTLDLALKSAVMLKA